MNVIVELSGGLGNQLFQFAFGYGIGQRTGADIAFDARSFPDRLGRTFSLDQLGVPCRLASPADSEALAWQRASLYTRFQHRVFGRPPRRVHAKTYYQEREWFSYDSRVYEITDDTYFSGYWQALPYVVEARSTILATLASVNFRSEQSYRLAEEVSACNSVAVHIRRGDYKRFDQSGNLWDVCDDCYYERGVSYIAGRVSDCRLFIFSDEIADIDAARFPKHAVKIVPSSLSAVESLGLLTRCKHHLISNSSFGWWGAWLSSHAAQVVVCPSYWMREKPTPRVLLSHSWTCVPSSPTDA